MAKNSVIEIEIDDPHKGSLHFPPMQSRIRGRFDSSRLLRNDDGAGAIARLWPEPIPGQRLSLDLDAGTASLIEPLNEPQHAGLREKLQAKGRRIGKGQDIPEC